MAVEVRLLRSLVAVADEGHVGRAAERLHLTQPALSKQIAQLEAATGLRLFDRHPRGMTPTDAGRLLVDRARHVVREADAFDALAGRTRRRVAGRLHVGFVGQAANERTPVLLRAFRERHPAVTVELRQYDMRDLTAGLGAGETDLAILRLPVGAADLVHEPLFVEPRVAVLPDDHRLARHEALDLRQLLDEPWVVSASPDPAYQRFALALDARAGRRPVRGPVVRTIDEYLEAVLSGEGIGLAPASAARYYVRPGIAYVPVPDAQPSVCSLSWSTDHEPGPAARAFVDVVRAQMPLG